MKTHKSQLRILGKKIKAIRVRNGMTQAQVAAETGYDSTYISMLETGKRNPTFVALCNISEALKLPLNEMLEDREGKPLIGCW